MVSPTLPDQIRMTLLNKMADCRKCGCQSCQEQYQRLYRILVASWGGPMPDFYSYDEYFSLPEKAKIEYSPPETNTVDRTTAQAEQDKGSTETMSGWDYINRPIGQQNYTHLRSMLQKAWDIDSTPLYQRFEVDAQFAVPYKNTAKLSNYIRSTFSVATVNAAHDAARQTYSRGRPPGALGRKTLEKLATSDSSDGTTYVPPTADTETSIPAQQAAQGEPIDLSEYVRLVAFDEEKVFTRRFVADTKSTLIDLRADLNGCVNQVNDKLAKIALNTPRVLVLERRELPSIEMGVQHRHFEKLMRMCSAVTRSGHHLNIWIHGPAGSGKSTACEKIAEAMGLNFYAMSKQSTEFGILGFVNVSGYQTTEFRKAFEHGGIFCADEIDGWAPDALIALNGALANGHCTFPDKSVPRHPDFVFVGAANTIGLGGSFEYVARYKADAAFANRFCFCDWPHDDALETHLCANEAWLERVRFVRAKLESAKFKQVHLITMRAAIYGESLLAAGLPVHDVDAAVLKQGMSDAQWDQIKPTMPYVEDYQGYSVNDQLTAAE